MPSEALQGPITDFHDLILIYTGQRSYFTAFVSVFLVSAHSQVSLCFPLLSLTVSHIDSCHVTGGGDEVEETNARLQHTDHTTNSQQPLQPHLGFLNVVHYIQQTEEQLVPHAHEKQHRPGRVVQP